jgi:DNA-binding IclR family transcriptional regulator
MEANEKSVKSARRVLELLEYFNPERPQATVMDIARTLGYPQSSTSELLRSLVELGYLHYDRHKRLYRPTVRVALLGAWVQPYLFREGHLLPMMDELSAKTGQLVALATQVGLSVHYIHVIQSTSTMRMHVPQGAIRPLLRSATGKLLLSREPDDLILKLTHRINAETPEEQRVKPMQLLREIEQIRKQGYALSADVVTPGGGMVAVLLPPSDGNQSLAIGLGGLTAVIKENCDEYVATLKEAIGRHLGPLMAGELPQQRSLAS